MSTCTLRTANTKPSRCKQELGLIRRCILTPVEAKFTGLDDQSAVQTFDNWLEAGIHAANPEDRFYPLPMTNGVEDNTTDPAVFTDAMGRQHQIMDGVFAFTQKFERDVCLTKRLKAFNDQEMRIIKFDKENAEVIEDGNGDYFGEKCKIFVSHPKASTTSELGEPSILITMVDPNEHDYRAFLDYDSNLSELDGLENVIMNVVIATTNFVITFTEACSGKDITAELAALSAKKTAWKIDKSGTIADVVAAPVYDSATKTFTAVAATMYAEGHSLKLADPTILNGLGVSNKEQEDWFDLPNPGA